MTITIGTLFILVFFVPGFLFTKAYYYAPFSKKYSKSTLLSEFTWIIVPAVIIHLIGLLIIKFFLAKYYVQFENIGQLIIDTNSNHPNLSNSGIDFWFLVTYNIGLWILTMLTGYVLNGFVRKSYLDKLFPFFRFDNEWYYYLSGDILDFPGVVGRSGDVDLVYVDVLANTGNETVLYSGICEDYYLKPDGGLESICLSNAKRGVFENALQPEAHTIFRDIPTNFFIIPNNNIININIRYFKATKKEEEEKKKSTSSTDIFLGFLLIITLLAILIALINKAQKADKPEEEIEQENIGAISAVLGWLAGLLTYFILHKSFWICFAIGVSVSALPSIVLLFWWVIKKMGKKKKNIAKPMK